jgi:adenosylmethionine-8-amino-7-oxononanoate aminotransferase
VGSTSPSGRVIAFGVIEDLRKALEADGDKIAAFMIEPIQGSAGYVGVLDLPVISSNAVTVGLLPHQRDT